MDTDARVLRGLARTHARKRANIVAEERTTWTQSAHEERGEFINGGGVRRGQSGNKRREASIVSRGYLHYIGGRGGRFAQSSGFIKASDKQLTRVSCFVEGVPSLRNCVNHPPTHSDSGRRQLDVSAVQTDSACVWGISYK